MSSGLIPLEDFEHAISLLSCVPTQPIGIKHARPRPRDEPGQRSGIGSVATGQAAQQRTPCLPLEIISLIGHHLFAASHLSEPAWLLTLQSPSLSEPSMQPTMHAAFRGLLQLSSACKAYRSLLAPLLWHSVHFHHPRHFGEFVQLMKTYKSISSPVCAIAGPCTGATPAFAWRQEYPLRLIRELHLVMPQKYPGFNQGLLVTLLRDGMNHSLRHVIWEAEELPAASTLKAMVAEDVHVPGKRRKSPVRQPHEEEKGGLACEIEQADIVRWTRAGRDGESYPAEDLLSPVRREPIEAHDGAHDEGMSSLSVNCKCFWPGHASLSHFTSLQHIRLTYYDLFLLPPHLASLLQNLRQPLLSLSMSTSKTSLFHSTPLINAGCFDHLQILDLYPVTPEYPLPQAICRSRKSLRILRLILDISANFANFDNLWKVLTGGGGTGDDDDTGPMDALEVLHVDPMPQQNTAPSFVAFVEACPRLEWINGRRKNSFAPGMETVNPDEITSAMYF